MKISKKRLGILALIAVAVVAVYPVMAQLLINVSVTGIVIGQTKEMTISAQTAVAVFGTAVVLPACATAAASSFADVATFTPAFGASLQSNTDYETWFCIGNIGTSAGIVTVNFSSTDGATYTFETATGGLLGLSFSPCSGTSIAGNGVAAVRLHVHTPSAPLNGQISLNGHGTFAFA